MTFKNAAFERLFTYIVFKMIILPPQSNIVTLEEGSTILLLQQLWLEIYILYQISYFL